MIVYICYDRYENDEWINVEYIGTDKDESIRKVKEEILPDFLCYGPDDCHSFQLQMVEMTKRDYNQLMKWYNDPTISLEKHGDSVNNSDYFNFMCELYDLTGQCNCCLISTDGCSDYSEIIRYYSVFYKDRDIEEVGEYEWVFSDEFNDLYEEFINMDDDKCLEIIKEYVRDTY